MKYLYVGINVFLIVMIFTFLLFKPAKNIISIDSIAKSITTSSFSSVNETVNSKEEKKEDSDISVDQVVSVVENNLSGNITSASVQSDVLETQVGTMSAYGLDCAGCSGQVGAGYDALSNNLYYYDPFYGALRIVAGDPKYPYGTVVRVNNSKIGTFLAIILDRGGDIGIGRRYMFDLLHYTEAEASEFGLSRNITFEILRYGY